MSEGAWVKVVSVVSYPTSTPTPTLLCLLLKPWVTAWRKQALAREVIPQRGQALSKTLGRLVLAKKWSLTGVLCYTVPEKRTMRTVRCQGRYHGCFDLLHWVLSEWQDNHFTLFNTSLHEARSDRGPKMWPQTRMLYFDHFNLFSFIYSSFIHTVRNFPSFHYPIGISKKSQTPCKGQ